MMTSNIFSRLLPSASDESPSLDASEGQHRDLSRAVDHTGKDIDEENLSERFQDQDLEHLLMEAAEGDHPTESTAFLSQKKARGSSSRQFSGSKSRPKWLQFNSRVPSNVMDDDDDEVPESLLLEAGKHPLQGEAGPSRSLPKDDLETLPPPVPGPTSRRTRAQWESARTQQRLHKDDRKTTPPALRMFRGRPGIGAEDPRERALWLWANVENLDQFLGEVYNYFLGRGMWSIVLNRILNLLQTAFVTLFTTFLLYGIDYSKLRNGENSTLSSVIYPKWTSRIHGLWNLILLFAAAYWMSNLIQCIRDIPKLSQLHNFYKHLLGIPDRDIQTASWQLVVSRLMALRDANLSTAHKVPEEYRKLRKTQRMDAHDIANRLMRRENYLIALFNKDIMDLTITLPLLGKRQFFSKTTQWAVNISILDFVFDENGQIGEEFTTDRNRRRLIDLLRRRLMTLGLISIFYVPFLAIFVCISYLFRYLAEFYKDPSQLTLRAFTPLAEWKFREFNELPHLFERRRNMAYPYADRYLEQFPKDKTEQLSDFVAFLAGSLGTVLVIFSIIDSVRVTEFQITPGKTVVWWGTILWAIFTSARRANPQEDLILDPEYVLNQVIECTHYCPAAWAGRLHTDEVRKDFTSLYQLKVGIFFEEILSMIFTPFILMMRLPQCSDRIIDFFREFTIHVDGLDKVCSFAVFDFKKGVENVAGPPKRGASREDPGLREDYYAAHDGKLMASYFNFLDHYGGVPTRAANGRHPVRSPFLPPPAFPATGLGMSSQNIAADRAYVAGRAPLGRQSFNPPVRSDSGGTRVSPIQSVLLDQAHLPSTSMMRHSPRQTAQSRYRPSRHPLKDPEELLEEEDPDRSVPLQPLNNSRGMPEDSRLGESWRTTQGGPAEEVVVPEDPGSDERGGVLGILKQFQKAQAEGRGVGVRI